MYINLVWLLAAAFTAHGAFAVPTGIVHKTVYGALGVPYTVPSEKCAVLHNTRVVPRLAGGELIKVKSLEECIDSCISKVCTYEGTACYLEHKEIAGFAYHEGMEGIVCAGASLPDSPDRTAHVIMIGVAVAVALLIRSLKLLFKSKKE